MNLLSGKIKQAKLNIIFSIIVILLNVGSAYPNNISSDSLVNFISKTFSENINYIENKEVFIKKYNEDKLNLKTHNSFDEIVDFSINTGKIFNKNGRPQAAINIFKITIQYIKEAENKPQQIEYKLYDLYNQIGIILGNLGNDNQSLENYLLAFKIAQTLNWDKGLAKSYNNIGTLYLEQGNSSRAEDLIKESIKINEKLGDKNDLQINYNNLASIYNNLGKYDNALIFYKKAQSVYDANDYHKNCVLYTNISQVYKNKKQYAEAYKYMNIAIDLMNKINDDALKVQVLLNMSEIEALLNNKPRSLSLINDAMVIIHEKNISDVTANSYRQISDIYMLWKDYDKAYEYMKKYVEVNDSLYKVYNKEKLLEFFSLYEFDKLELQNRQLLQSSQIKELTIEKQEYLLISSIIIVLISVLSFTIIVRKIKSEKEKKALIAKQREQMLIQEKLLYQKDIGDLKSEIDLKNRQLISYTINMAKGNEFHAEIIQQLESVQKTKADEPLKKEINDIAKKIYQYGNDNSNEEFKLYFESVHPDFYKSILQTHANLTQNELRLCAFLKLGLSTKEIASLTFREVRSVESSRNRLRKKINLPPEENIQTYLSRF